MIEKLQISKFDKRDASSFNIHCMLYLDRNVPFKLYYALVISEILHIAMTITYLINMVTRANLLLIRMVKQISVCLRIASLLKKICTSHYFISL